MKKTIQNLSVLLNFTFLMACAGGNGAVGPNPNPAVGTAVCGNSVQETGEACDGNTAQGTCSGDCQTFTANPANPQNPNNSGPRCGDGTQDPGEFCDDGNNLSSDGCSPTCQVEPAPAAAVCGNGQVQAGEGCDDGNTNNGDGCSSICQIEQQAGNGANANMSFFVTSVGNGVNGGNFGGLTGADAFCQNLANAAGAPAAAKTWHAYLSSWVSLAGPHVNARDRIGAGPWRNYNGTVIANSVAELHNNGITENLILTETGLLVPANEHDILTGSNAQGMAFEFFGGNNIQTTCIDWTDGTNGGTTFGYVGHTNWQTEVQTGQRPNSSWNSVHETIGCSQQNLRDDDGAARLYCFAIN